MIQKLRKDIPNEILKLMPAGISKAAAPKSLHEAGPIVVGVVTAEQPAKNKQLQDAQDAKATMKEHNEPEGLAHHFWR